MVSQALDKKAERVLTKAVFKVSEVLGLTRDELATILGTSTSTLSRAVTGGVLAVEGSKQEELALILVRIWKGIDTMTGGNAQAAHIWFNSSNAHLNAAPAELVKKTEGLIRVANYLDAFRARI